MIPLRLATALLVLFTTSLQAQNSLTMADAILKGRSVLAPANLRQLQWIPGTSQFTHAVNGRVVRVQAADLKTDTLDLLSGMNTGLKDLGATPLDALPAFSWIDADRLWFNTGKEIFTFSLKEGIKRQNWYPAEAENVDVHDKTFKVAYTLGKELKVNIGGKDLGVAKSEKDGIMYGKSVHREEFGIFKGTFWSPSGRYLAFYRMDESMVTPYPIYQLDSMPAQARMIRYPYAGTQSHHVTVGIYDTQTGKSRYLNTGEPAEQYLTNIAWTPDDRYVLIAVVNRAQNHLWLNQYDATTGAFVKTLFEETAEKWVEPENPPVFVPGSNTDFIWQSEREGYNHLYLYNLAGKMLRRISLANAPVTRFIGFSADGKRCFFQTADDNGMSRYCYAAQVYENSGITRLGADSGNHNAWINSNGEWLLDIYSSFDVPRKISVAPVKDPQQSRTIFIAPNPLAAYSRTEVHVDKLESGGVTLNTRLIIPSNFDPAVQYPVLLYVYNGPHVQLVQNNWMAGAEPWMLRLAEQGILVYTVDGRGSANRGFDFESAVFRRLGDAEIEDQLAGVRYLRSLPFVDTARIGVYGWSYGGFMTTSLLTRPEAKGLFKCGIAGGPVIDWRMYEIMYTERYMDTPQENPDGYGKNSLFNYIDNLDARLLMIHGSSDDVVLWQHSLRYIRECVRRGRPIDYFVYPEHPHNVQGRDRVHLFEKIERFLKENLAN